MPIVPAGNEVFLTFQIPLTSPDSTCACTQRPKDMPYRPGGLFPLETKLACLFRRVFQDTSPWPDL